MMEILTVAPGSKFKVGGISYELVKVSDDGGFNWLGEDGKHKLAQNFYFHGLPTLAKLETMKKHLCV